MKKKITKTSLAGLKVACSTIRRKDFKIGDSIGFNIGRKHFIIIRNIYETNGPRT